MKKVIFFAIIAMAFLLNYLIKNSKPLSQVRAQAVNTEYQFITPTFIPTRTAIPTVTIGYESTLMVANATADEARRINAQATSEAEQRILSYAQLTAASDERSHEVLMWTQIAGPTVIPLTATAAVIANTQIAESQRIVAAGYTAQADAPTQQAALLQLQATAQFARVNEVVKIIAMICLILFTLAGVAFFVRWPVLPVEEANEEPETETTVWVRSDKDQGANSKLLKIPCTSDQLTELAEKITTGKKTLAINNWEGSGTLFTRAVIHQVRGWLQENKFAVATSDGQLVPTKEGFAFLNGWLELTTIPEEYEFAEPEEGKDQLGEFVPMNSNNGHLPSPIDGNVP